MQTEQQTATDLQTKPTDLGWESVCGQLLSTIASIIYDYYSDGVRHLICGKHKI